MAKLSLHRSSVRTRVYHQLCPDRHLSAREIATALGEPVKVVGQALAQLRLLGKVGFDKQTEERDHLAQQVKVWYLLSSAPASDLDEEPTDRWYQVITFLIDEPESKAVYFTYREASLVARSTSTSSYRSQLCLLIKPDGSITFYRDGHAFRLEPVVEA